MKRELLQNVKTIPYTSGDVIDRTGFLSAIAAVCTKTAGSIKLEVTHADAADGTFETVSDTRLFVSGNGETDGLKAGETANFDLDLIGCKPFIKITLSGTAAEGSAAAVVLGDHCVQPV